MPDFRIDLVSIGHKPESTVWEYGNVMSIPLQVAELSRTIEEIITNSIADWVLFWDTKFGKPDIDLIKKLVTQPVDVFHVGLKVGTKGLPDVLNYVHPTWLYNIDGSTDVSHSNFRLSFSACMIRTGVLKKIGNIQTAYASWQMAGVAYGYRVLKQGGIIRYHADLLQVETQSKAHVPLNDEWVFARQFFTKKWQLWSVLNKEGVISNFRHWLSVRHIQYVKLAPILHSSAKTDTAVQYKTMSVLAPTLDRYPYLEEELRELNEQTILPLEILITDQTNKEHRQTIDFSKYAQLKVRYFPQDEKGQCVAWNKLIDEAEGEYVFFFGDDAYNIKPDLLERMLQTMQRFDADMVASNVREKGITYGAINHHIYMSDTFPITLIKKSVVMAAGGMDMFFNKNVKADHDLAMRCHLNGALMIFDPSAEIGHHRAPSGGLRAHNARVITNFMTKNTITKILNPTTSEIFIAKKYYTHKQFVSHVRIKYMNQLIVNGSILKKFLRIMFLLYKIPSMKKGYQANLQAATAELAKRGILRD